jgi:uncharacterized protein YjbI with pentapeptide repeats
MNQTLKTIIDNYRFGLRSTPNIQVLGKKFSDEIIKLPSTRILDSIIRDQTFVSSSFRNSNLINMKFIDLSFESSSFKTCMFENCLFQETDLREAQFDNCVFKNCRFINSNLTDIIWLEIIFNECTFSNDNFNNSIFESCHFVKPIFKDVKGGRIGSAVLIDSKFSNSKTSFEFQGEVFFAYKLEQIDKFLIDESEE